MVALLRFAAVAALGVCSTHAWAAPDPASCSGAIALSERAEHLPAQVLSAIGIVESGRIDPHTGTVAPWPWTINVAGAGHVFETAVEAIAAVRAAQAAGIASIDVGCMQVNLLHHPQAFATLEEAFDPTANVRYAAGFLVRLHTQAGTWPAAVASYHSATAALGLPYARQVAMLWPQAARYGMVVQAAPHAPDPMAVLEQAVDPAHVLTPEFRAQLMASVEFRRQRDVLLGLAPPAPPTIPATLDRSAPSARPVRLRLASSTLASVGDIDPGHLLTSEFRAERLADEVFRRRRDSAIGWARPDPARPAGAAR